jgi:tetratricopeptide (TPR) repeat protein
LGKLPPEAVGRLSLAYAGRGKRLEENGDIDSAIKSYEKATGLAPENKEAATLLEGARAKLSAEKEAEAQKLYNESIACAEKEADEIKKLLKIESGYRLVQSHIDTAADCLTKAVNTKGDAAEKDIMRLKEILEEQKDRAAAQEAAAAEKLAKKDAAHLKSIVQQLLDDTNYITRIATEEHNHLKVYVNSKWHYAPETLKKEQIRVIESRLIQHLQVYHSSATPRVEIFDASGNRIGKTGLFGVSAD